MKSLSWVRLFATPWTVAYEVPPSMGFSRQEYWSGQPFSSPGIFPTQGLNPDRPHCRQMLYHLTHQGIPKHRRDLAYNYKMAWHLEEVRNHPGVGYSGSQTPGYNERILRESKNTCLEIVWLTFLVCTHTHTGHIFPSRWKTISGQNPFDTTLYWLEYHALRKQ